MWRSGPSDAAAGAAVADHPVPRQSDRTDGGLTVADAADDSPASGVAQAPADAAGARCVPGPMHIHDIQGRAHGSPCVGLRVGPVEGIVTAVTEMGFIMQDPDPDDDPATSEGLEVMAAAPLMLSAGDGVAVSGTVDEVGQTPNLTVTELIDARVTLKATGRALPDPVVLGDRGRRPPTEVIAPAVDEQDLDPPAHGLDFYESLEGMRVAVEGAIASSGTAASGEVVVLPDQGGWATHRTERGGVYVTPEDFNPERVIVDDALVTGAPLVATGDRFDGPIVGVMGYANGNYRLCNTERLPGVVHAEPSSESTELTGSADELVIATLNVDNLARAERNRLAAFATLVTVDLGGPDLVVLEEVQDDNGTDPGVLTADANYAALSAAIASAGGPVYDWRDLPPTRENADGGVAGGNIRVGFLFDPDRLELVDRDSSEAELGAAVRETESGPELHPNPARLAPSDPAWNASRKPLVGEFVFQGNKLLVVGCHFRSRLEDDPLFGATQPPLTPSAEQRQAQAQLVAHFVNRWLAADPEAAVVVAGDLNDFDFSTTLELLRDASLTELADLLPPGDRYSYVYQGNAQLLDHVLVGPSLVDGASTDIVHGFADAPAQTRASDHDPLVVRIDVGQ
ncbi:MAG: endonuclease/exonuclease/phosphatase family protein [Polyangiaceae bacterium]|nr:endonuclease/exonuclease/phosphatase family protein [Polyangiaceae bacterium]